MSDTRTWNLNHIFPLPKFDALAAEIRQDLPKLEKAFLALQPNVSEKDFAVFVKKYQSVLEKITKLYNVPVLLESVDHTSQQAQLLKSKATDLYLKSEEVFRKITHWLQGKDVSGKKVLDDKNASRLFASLPDLTYVFQYARAAAEHSLSEAEERIIVAKDMTGETVLKDLRDIVETEFRYTFKPTPASKPKTITTSAELMSYVRDPDPKIREGAYKTILSKYQEHIQKFFLIYQAVVKNWNQDAQLRGFPTAISKRNHENHVPDKAIEILLDVCGKNAGIFQNYFKWKAKELGVKKLRRFDLYAPLAKKKEAKIPFSQSIKMVLETFQEFSPTFAKHAKRIIDAGHIDSHPKPGKRGGAYCMTITPDIIPYVLLNYDGTLRDVSTVAHELGHGVHSLFAAHHSVFTQHANLPLAETASTFGEMVLFEKLLGREKNKELRKAMLADKMADSYATIIRQNYIIQFERRAHEAIQKGITSDGLSDIWLQTLQEQFGDSIVLDPQFRYEWAYIPHMVHTPFYCYAYNFGELLSLALFAEYKKQGKSFIAKIENILASGGSQDPVLVLKKVGIDMTSPAFWQKGFDVIKGWQKTLEGL